MTVVCLACPVSVECEDYVERYQITAGFWAGQDRQLRANRSGGAA